METAYLLLGTNVGKRESWLALGIRETGINCGNILRSSSVYETASWPDPSGPAFLNQVIELETELTAEELMSRILEIEQAAGRERNEKWAPRTLDIDILFYGTTVSDRPGLHLPHPRIQDRRFTLVPLNELIPGFVHPVLNRTVGQLLTDCKDELPVAVYRQVPASF